MNIEVELALAVAVLLVATRLSALFLLSPLFAAAGIPPTFRILFTIGLGFVLVLALNIDPAQSPRSLGGLAQAMVFELILGGLFAFGVFAAFGAFLFGGRILDFQMGFGVANLIDPATNLQSPLIGTVLSMMAVVTFFLLDGHHLMIRGIAFSLERIPPGSSLGEISLPAIVAQFGVMFTFGLALVAPAVITLLLLDAAMAMAARTMPQVNMFIVGLPLKIFVGLTVLTISLNYMGPMLERLFESIFRFWDQAVLT